jgi:D-aminopeptidase
VPADDGRESHAEGDGRCRDRDRRGRLGAGAAEAEVTFLTSAHAELGLLIPGVTRGDARTLRWKAREPVEGVKLLRALIVLAGAR